MNKGANIAIGVVNSGLTIGTCVLVAKETPKYIKAMEELKAANEPGNKIKFGKKCKVFFKSYWPAILTGTGSVATQIGGTIINIKSQANLLAAYAGAEKLYKRYGNEVKEKLGMDTHHDILKGIAEKDKMPEQKDDGKQMFWNDHFGYIRCRKVDLLEALNEFKDGIANNVDVRERKWFYTVGMLVELIKDCEYEPDLPDYQLGWSEEGILVLTNEECNIKYSFTPAESKINGTKYEILEFNVEPYEPDGDGLPAECTKEYPKEEE